MENKQMLDMSDYVYMVVLSRPVLSVCPSVRSNVMSVC